MVTMTTIILVITECILATPEEMRERFALLNAGKNKCRACTSLIKTIDNE
jgi:hypothetical protein